MIFLLKSKLTFQILRMRKHISTIVPAPFTHVKVHLLGAPASNVPRRGTVETINGRYEFEYKISKNGVFDARAR